MISVKAAYNILCMRIDSLVKKNDKESILRIEKTRLFQLLTPTYKKRIMDLIIDKAFEVVEKLSSGKITPMELDERNRTRGTYIYYLRHLKYEVLPVDPIKAHKLALSVYLYMLQDKVIDNKSYFDEDYFSILLYPTGNSDVFHKVEGEKC